MKPYPLILAGLLLFSPLAPAIEKTGAAAPQHGKQEQPYALDQTEQTFTKTVHGGVQHVIVKPGGDPKQIKLIQAHLLKIANEFRKGDFSVTERMHGPDMPGLTQLKMAEPNDIQFKYEALENGAQIHYSTEYPEYVQALHAWFDAQQSAHGNAVIPEHLRHHATPAD